MKVFDMKSTENLALWKLTDKRNPPLMSTKLNSGFYFAAVVILLTSHQGTPGEIF
jgi:hypothetical protein